MEIKALFSNFTNIDMTYYQPSFNSFVHAKNKIVVVVVVIFI